MMMIIIIIRQVMPLHGQFERDTKYVKTEESWDWFSKGDLKRKTESLLVAAQGQALNTNSVRKNIYHQVESDMCRLCDEKVENVTQIVSACTMLAKRITNGVTIKYVLIFTGVSTRSMGLMLVTSGITIGRRGW